MASPEQNRTASLQTGPRASAFVLASAVVFALIVLATPAQAQTYSMLHSFTHGADGAFPIAGLTMDAAGNLYGTAYYGGSAPNCFYCGTVFKLAPKGSGWIFTTLYSFNGQDGALPGARVIFGPGGSLYGTTVYGGTGHCPGTVFSLRPQARACQTASCPWAETVLYNFCSNNPYDGWDANDIAFDPAGNLYGTTSQGGPTGHGVVYELTPSNGSWTETVIYGVPNGSGVPYSGVILDQTGNLYGTGYIGDSGTVYELTTPGWGYQLLHQFSIGDGFDPFGGLIFDKSGNLYGGTLCGGSSGEGTVYEMSPSNGAWTLTTLYNFTTGDPNYCGGPYASLVMDAAGNLYGTTHSGGAYKYGSVFKLTPSNGGWTYTSLHDFCAGGPPCSDGAYPFSNVVFDSKGNLYGTASQGGAYGSGEYEGGVVWKITP